MSVRRHFLTASEPLYHVFHGPVTAVCGYAILKPKQSLMQEFVELGLPEFSSLRGDCPKCARKIEEEASARVEAGKKDFWWIYGVVEAQEAMNQAAEAAERKEGA